VRRFVSAAKIQKNPDTQKNNGEKFCIWTYGVGVLLINKVSADDDEFVTLYVVSDRMSERRCFAIINGRDINASTLELVDKCSVVIGTHA
jgi:hypothetical protein